MTKVSLMADEAIGSYKNKEGINRELRRKIVVGSVLLSVHKQQGTVPYLIQVIEPYLKKSDRKLFGLPF